MVDHYCRKRFVTSIAMVDNVERANKKALIETYTHAQTQRQTQTIRISQTIVNPIQFHNDILKEKLRCFPYPSRAGLQATGIASDSLDLSVALSCDATAL